MSLNRSEIRDWFKQALSAHKNTLGEVYPVRVVLFEQNDMPEVFTNIYISDGETRETESGLGLLTYMSVQIAFNSQEGKDEGLDHMEYIADRAIAEYRKIKPPPFDFYKERFVYSGESEDPYEQLNITLQLITR